MKEPLPLPGGTDENVAFVRTALDEYGYYFDRVSARLGLPIPSRSDGVNGDLRSSWRRAWFRAVRQHQLRRDWDELDVLIRLFEVGESMPARTARRVLGVRLLEELTACGLVHRADGTVRPRFLIGTVGPVRVATDTDNVANDDTRIGVGPNPLVMPVYLETHLFAAAIDRQRVARGLDLCTGSGVHALLLASHCEEVVGVDVSARTVGIARFNARLNGIENARFVQGSLWTPLTQQRFDVITANPPYQPELNAASGSNWWGAEVRGEGVWKPLVEQLHQHLRPGGRCFVILQGLSWQQDPFVPRVQRYAPSMQVRFDSFGAAELAGYQQRYAGHGQLAQQLTSAEYGVLRLASTAPERSQEAL